MALVIRLSYTRQVELDILFIFRRTFKITLLIGEPAHEHDDDQDYHCDDDIIDIHRL